MDLVCCLVVSRRTCLVFFPPCRKVYQKGLNQIHISHNIEPEDKIHRIITKYYNGRALCHSDVPMILQDEVVENMFAMYKSLLHRSHWKNFQNFNPLV